MSTTLSPQPLFSPTETMPCMEVWGGNDAADVVLDVAGLDAFIWGRPFGSHHKGGDLHYLSSCATGRIARMLLADVAGHGGSVAKISENLRGLMRRYVNYIDQTRFVEELNRRFGRDRSPDVSSGTFATALMMSWFGPQRQLGICNAGHPAPFLSIRGSQSWSALEVVEEHGHKLGEHFRNLPLGVMDEAGYDRLEVQMHIGDRLLCFTDALIETIGQGNGKAGLRILGEFLNSRPADEDPRELIAALVEIVDGQNELDDDLTIMILRPNGKEPWRALGRRFGGPLKVLWAVAHGTFGRFREVPWPEMTLANLGGALFEPLNRLRKPKKP